MSPNYEVDVCIVGLGPAGIGAAVTFSSYDDSSTVLCIDSGPAYIDRTCNLSNGGECTLHDPCRVISGFGGCMLFGGGKLSDYPAGSGLRSILKSEKVAKQALSISLDYLHDKIDLVKHVVPDSDYNFIVNKLYSKGFLIKHYDVYYYTNNGIRLFLENVYNELCENNIIIMHNTMLLNIENIKDRYEVTIKKDNIINTIKTKYIILAMGRSGKSILESLNNNLSLSGYNSGLEIGVRLEFSNNIINEYLNIHGDLKLLFNDSRTFCTVKNGSIISYYLDDILRIDGNMDISNPTKFTSISLLKKYETKHNKEIYNEIRKRYMQISKGRPLYQSLNSYLKNDGLFQSKINELYSHYKSYNVNYCFPNEIASDIRKNVHFFSSELIPSDKWEDVYVIAPHIEYNGLSFPVKSDFSIGDRLYLIGDCVGQFRGFLQALCSGQICAEKIWREMHGK